MKVSRHAYLVCLVVGACGSDDEPGGGDTIADTAGDTVADTTGDTGTDAVADTAGDAGGDTAPDVVLTPEQGLEALVAAWCPGYARSWCENAAATCGCNSAPGFPEPAACRATFEARCRSELGSYLEVVRGGQAVYRPEAAEACLGVLEGLLDRCMLMPNDLFFVSCPILSPPGGFTGLPGEGQACEGTCASGLRCGSEGLCETPGAASAACADLRDCAPELTCSATFEVPGTCHAPVFALTGSPCTTPDDCTGDLSCFASARKVCVAPVSGQACKYDDDCVADEYCVLGAGDWGTCTPAPGDGDACGNGAVCRTGLACNMETTLCGPLPRAGEPCGLGPMGPMLCAEGLACLDRGCGDMPGRDEPCGIGSPNCGPGLGCAFEPEGSFCREPVGDGERCENDATCKDGFFCNFAEGLCRADLALGQVCVNGNECGEGACLPDATFTFRCAATPGLGDACFIDECTAGLRCRTPYTAGACVPDVFCRALRF